MELALFAAVLALVVRSVLDLNDAASPWGIGVDLGGLAIPVFALVRRFRGRSGGPARRDDPALTENDSPGRDEEVGLRERLDRSLFETLSHGVVYRDAEGGFVDANAAAEKILGMSREAMRARSLSDPAWKFVHEDASAFPAQDHPVMVALRTGEAVRDVVMGVPNGVDGTMRWLSVTAMPLFREGSATPHLVYALLEDITKRRATERERDQIFEMSQDIICVATFDGYYNFANRAMEKILGYSQAIISSTSFLEMVLPEDREATLQAMSVLAEGRSVHDFENRFRAADGSIVWLSWNSTPDVGNRLIYATAHDVTAKKRFEAELEQARIEAERANRAKSEFLANMSHEIRTPLNAVTGFAELLSSVLVDEKQVRYAQSIKAAGRSLLLLINDILDLSKIEAGRMEMVPGSLRLAGVLDELSSIFEPSALDKHLSLRIECAPDLPSVLRLDEIRLRQILFNLVGNAFKFTHQGGVVVAVSCRPSGAGSVDLLVEVRDTGIGIPLEEQKAIFETFHQRSGQNTREYGGTGLGLAISRRLIEMMGGELSVESVPGAGSCFRFRLPGVEVEADFVPVTEIDIEPTATISVPDALTAELRAPLARYLCADLLPKLAEQSAVIGIDRLAAMVPEMEDAARRHGSAALAGFAARLSVALDMFDVEAIRKLKGEIETFAIGLETGGSP